MLDFQTDALLSLRYCNPCLLASRAPGSWFPLTKITRRNYKVDILYEDFFHKKFNKDGIREGNL